MRRENKIGMVLTAIVVLGGAAYYKWSDKSRQDIPMTAKPATEADKGDAQANRAPATAPVAADRSKDKPGSTPSRKREAIQPRTRVANAQDKKSDGWPKREDAKANERSSRTGRAKPSADKRRSKGPSRMPVNRSKGPRTDTSRTVEPSKPTADKAQTPKKPDAKDQQPRRPVNRVDTKPAKEDPARSAKRDATKTEPRTNRKRPESARRAKGPQRGTQVPSEEDINRELAARARRNAVKEPRSSRNRNTTSPSKPQPGSGKKGGTAVDIHKVQSGDTFSLLSQSYYGTVKHTDFLIRENPQIKDPNRLSIGMEIRIPEAPKEVKPEPKEEQAKAAHKRRTTKSSERTYTVKAGDSFYAIAKNVLKDESRWQELFDLNKELVKGDATALQIGQVIVLPAG